jgi:methylase of polypeptide subunit release factors
VTDTTELMKFGPLTIAFDHRILRPRPWTELQSDWAAELLESAPDGPVLEVCAGAGHIGLLAVAGSDRRIVLVDANQVACTFARTNADRARDPRSVEVRHGLMDEVLAPGERFALVIADPPWVPSSDTAQHPDDPLIAIDGGDDGLDLVRTCLRVIGEHLLPGGSAVLQVGGEQQVQAVAAHVDTHPELGLRVAGSRHAERGALVHLTRRPAEQRP